MRDLSLHILDIVQNSLRAGADSVEISVSEENGILLVEIADNGCGIKKEMLESVTDPFTTTRTTRKTGMGLSLFKASAQIAGGGMTIISVEGEGTRVSAWFETGNIDRLPLGSVDEVYMNLVAAFPEVLFRLLLKSGKGSFKADTGEMKDKLGELPVNSLPVLEWIREYIAEGILKIFGGVLNEIYC